MAHAFVPVEVTFRESIIHPGLFMARDGQYMTFRYEESWETYELRAGDAELVACSPRAFPAVALLEHVRATAVAYAEEYAEELVTAA